MTESPRPPEKEVSQKLIRPNFSLTIFSFLLSTVNDLINAGNLLNFKGSRGGGGRLKYKRRLFKKK